MPILFFSQFQSINKIKAADMFSYRNSFPTETLAVFRAKPDRRKDSFINLFVAFRKGYAKLANSDMK